jgi:hypothetical protein
MAGTKKQKTYQQAAAMQRKAVRFLRDVVGDDDKADEIEGLSVDEYVARKRLTLTNPAQTSTHTPRREKTMAEGNDPRTKQEILDSEAELLGILDDIWNLHYDKDEDSGKADLLDASDETCDILNDFDDERFPFDEEEEEGAEQEEAAA